ncbi:MAG TPA: glycosyltransferase family 39 protein, partial [Phenylobacterium sp.]|nr:glycosyltransferase family 39 protein [Phenylobacterium sp.]
LAVRVWRLDLALVGYDEAAAASLVAAWRLDGLFPLTGIVSSIGVPNPPAWPYLLALGLLIFDSPWAVVILGVGASMLSILLTWWLGRRWVGPWAALAGAAFYAVNFWSSLLGRSGWQPVFLQVPVILCLDALLILAIRRRPWAFVLACGWLGLMVQLHYIAGVFALMLPIAAWPARRVLRPTHIISGALVGFLFLTPFLIYELHPTIRLRDFFALASDAGVTAHIDLESWNLFWSVAGGRGAAGLGATESERLQQALGRWSNAALIGVPLVAAGGLAAVGGWPRGWRGVLLAAWMLSPVVGLARHTIGVIFHYLYLAVPGMALCVGALAEWSSFRPHPAPRIAVWAALGLYGAVSTATLVVVLNHVGQTGEYPASARPLGLNLAAADAVRAVRPPTATVLIGGSVWRTEVLRFSLGYRTPSRVFDDCAVLPVQADAMYLLDDEQSPAARTLADAEAPLLARVPRPDGAFLVYGAPRGQIASEERGAQALNCGDREPQPRT